MSSASWFARALAPWYAANRRSLPWRSVRDPYLIWLSEVILQQTRVEQGLAYYARFVRKYPTVERLASATEDEVLKDWQGLGYYSRARNMLATARLVMEAHRGRFPGKALQLEGLKGVGPYTAAAVASIAYGDPVAVVDGNVFRVLARFFGIHEPIDRPEGKRVFKDLAQREMDVHDPGTHNQAVMELGALVCTPRRPDCGSCPLRERCVAHAEGLVERLPVKVGRTKVRERHFNFLLPEDELRIWLVKRGAGDIWQGLYTPPLIESRRRFGMALVQGEVDGLLGKGWKVMRSPWDERHLLSHQVIHARFWKVARPKGARVPVAWSLIGRSDYPRFPVPRLVERALITRLKG